MVDGLALRHDMPELRTERGLRLAAQRAARERRADAGRSGPTNTENAPATAPGRKKGKKIYHSTV